MTKALQAIRAGSDQPSRNAAFRHFGILALLAFAIALPAIASPYTLFQLAGVMAFAVAALGLNVITGYTGQVSLAHNAFFAVGAYIGAMSTAYLGAGPLGSVVIAAVVSFAAGFVAGIPAQRLRGLYLALVTLAIAVSVTPMIKQFEAYTGGVVGFRVDQPAPPAWLPISQDSWIYYLVLLFAAIAFFMTYNLLSGSVGRSFVGTKEAELAAGSLGIDVARSKVMAFAYGSMLAGIGGALANFSIGYIAPDSFSLMLSIGFLAAAVVGGINTIWGAIIAGIFLQYVPSFASDISQALSGAIYGGILIICVIVMPKGILGSLPRLIANFQTIRRESRAEVAKALNKVAN